MNNIEGMCRYTLTCGCIEEEERDSLTLVSQCPEKHTLLDDDLAFGYPKQEMIIQHKETD